MTYIRKVVVIVEAKDRPTCDRLHEAVSVWVADLLELCDPKGEVDDDEAEAFVEDQ